MWSVLISKVCEMFETSKSFVGKKVGKRLGKGKYHPVLDKGKRLMSGFITFGTITVCYTAYWISIVIHI